MATSAEPRLLAVDAYGCPRTDELAGLDDHAAAATAREAVDALLQIRLFVVAAVSTPDNGGMGAIVTVREVTESGVAYRTSTASAASGGEAVGRAVLRAFDVESSFVEPAAERWAREPGLRSVTVVRGDGCRALGATDDSARHQRLLATMPGPGTLAVDAADAVHRVLRLPSVAVVCTIDASSRAATRFDAWAHDFRARCR